MNVNQWLKTNNLRALRRQVTDLETKSWISNDTENKWQRWSTKYWTYKIPESEIPDQITHLRVLTNPTFDLNSLPHNLEYLSFLRPVSGCIQKLPETLEVLCLDEAPDLKIVKFPSNLKILSVGKEYHHELPPFPESLEELWFDHESNYSHYYKLPGKLRVWQMGREWNHPVFRLPDSLEVLEISPDYSYDLVNIPKFLRYISVSQKWTRNLPDLDDWIEVDVYYTDGDSDDGNGDLEEDIELEDEYDQYF